MIEPQLAELWHPTATPIGRRDLMQQLAGHLRRRASPVLVHGPPGSGTTELLQAFARAARQELGWAPVTAYLRASMSGDEVDNLLYLALHGGAQLVGTLARRRALLAADAEPRRIWIIELVADQPLAGTPAAAWIEAQGRRGVPTFVRAASAVEGLELAATLAVPALDVEAAGYLAALTIAGRAEVPDDEALATLGALLDGRPGLLAAAGVELGRLGAGWLPMLLDRLAASRPGALRDAEVFRFVLLNDAALARMLAVWREVRGPCSRPLADLLAQGASAAIDRALALGLLERCPDLPFEAYRISEVALAVLPIFVDRELEQTARAELDRACVSYLDYLVTGLEHAGQARVLAAYAWRDLALLERHITEPSVLMQQRFQRLQAALVAGLPSEALRIAAAIAEHPLRIEGQDVLRVTLLEARAELLAGRIARAAELALGLAEAPLDPTTGADLKDALAALLLDIGEEALHAGNAHVACSVMRRAADPRFDLAARQQASVGLAQALTSEGLVGEALAALTDALVLASERRDAGQAMLILLRMMDLLEEPDPETFLTRAKQALELALLHPEAPLAPEVALRVADACLRNRLLAEAEGTAHQILERWDDEGPVRLEATLLLGRVALRQGAHEAAKAALTDALTVASTLADTELLPEVLASLALVELHLGERDAALDHMTHVVALRHASAAPDALWEDVGLFVTAATDHQLVLGRGAAVEVVDHAAPPTDEEPHAMRSGRMVAWLDALIERVRETGAGLGTIAILLAHRGHMHMHAGDAAAAVGDLATARRLRALLHLSAHPEIDRLLGDAVELQARGPRGG